ncbi:laccase-1 precursor [Diplodia corticola]|uniref:Laccase-1 n=1 Tax=Diplodia corticola TaxID=236234 RepID=A0A1J9QV07_9PEZI|nr:laccase-1 precursor [Diplodia corticola]OJD32225.1 laccase-1 precursor [Diplodia corticola]
MKSKCSSLLSLIASVLTVGASASNLTQALPQTVTNGQSIWGTLDVPRFPDFLTNNPLPCGVPWGDREREGLSNDPYSQPPNTGVTRHYHFTLSRQALSPDGVNKSGIFVNGEFPGPAIEANWGDWIEVRVHNHIDGPEEGTSIHWHGLTQKDTQYFDGVPGVTQCPIAPGASFTYRFRADVYGTSWWHSHYSAQWTAGVFGPMIIYGPKHVGYDVDVGPVMLHDYSHRQYTDMVADAASTSQNLSVYAPSASNNLINGKNNYDCSQADVNATCVNNAGLSQFRFTPGATHRLRLMNTGAAALVHFSIDGHQMQVIAQDMVPVVPYDADYITLGAAQRTDILVKADASPNATYWMRSTIALNCSMAENTQALAIISYESDDDNAAGPLAIETPTTAINPAAAAADQKPFLCLNDPLNTTTPFFPHPLIPTPDLTLTFTANLTTNATGHHVWTLNNRTQRADYNAPSLLAAAQGNTSFPDAWNVYDTGRARTVRIVINNAYPSSHPMHLHGHAFQVLAEGPGVWDGVIDESNAANPARRDTMLSRRGGHLVIQFEADNPGAWTYHCHIAWHAGMGYNIQLLERAEELPGSVPMVMEETCRRWDEYTSESGVVVDQIDSGI